MWKGFIIDYASWINQDKCIDFLAKENHWQHLTWRPFHIFQTKFTHIMFVFVHYFARVLFLGMLEITKFSRLLKSNCVDRQKLSSEEQTSFRIIQKIISRQAEKNLTNTLFWSTCGGNQRNNYPHMTLTSSLKRLQYKWNHCNNVKPGRTIWIRCPVKTMGSHQRFNDHWILKKMKVRLFNEIVTDD